MLHTAKVGDRRPITVTFSSSNALDSFTGATTPLFTMSLSGEPPKVNAATASIVGTPGATITLSYSPDATDVDTKGYYQVEWQITAGGVPVKLPSQGYDVVWITD